MEINYSSEAGPCGLVGASSEYGMVFGATTAIIASTPQTIRMDLQLRLLCDWVVYTILGLMACACVCVSYSSLKSISVAAQVYECNFWMMLHGAGTPKPTVCFSNMVEVQKLHLGALRKSEKERRTTRKTTRI